MTTIDYILQIATENGYIYFDTNTVFLKYILIWFAKLQFVYPKRIRPDEPGGSLEGEVRIA